MKQGTVTGPFLRREESLPAGPEPLALRQQEGSSSGSFRILVSSKDPGVGHLLAERLPRGEGFEVLTPNPSWGVVEAVIDQLPDLLVLDIDWEGGAPTEAVRLLRKLRPSLRIVALSAETCLRDAEIVSEGVCYYTVKPVGADVVEVIRAAARACRRSCSSGSRTR